MKADCRRLHRNVPLPGSLGNKGAHSVGALRSIVSPRHKTAPKSCGGLRCKPDQKPSPSLPTAGLRQTKVDLDAKGWTCTNRNIPSAAKHEEPSILLKSKRGLRHGSPKSAIKELSESSRTAENRAEPQVGAITIHFLNGGEPARPGQDSIKKHGLRRPREQTIPQRMTSSSNYPSIHNPSNSHQKDKCEGQLVGNIPRLAAHPISPSGNSDTHTQTGNDSTASSTTHHEHTIPTMDSKKGLVEATLVESLPFDIEAQAQEYAPQSEEKARLQGREEMMHLGNSLGCLCLIMMGVVFLVLCATGVFRPRAPKTVVVPSFASPTALPTTSPTPFLMPLPETSIQAIQENPDAPQGRAYQWLQNDILLETYSETRLFQRFALAAIYYATQGDAWTLNQHWLSYAHHECSWYSKWREMEINGTGICDSEGHYVMLLLTNNGLAGTLPPQVGMLSKLETLDVAHNDIEGQIPSEIGLMNPIKNLVVDVNELTGQLPTEVGQLPHLESLYCHTNPLTGTMPTELGRLTKLEILQWALTKTGGSIPSELGLLPLTGLHLSTNSLSGSIPTEIFLITSLREYLVLDRNLLTGSVPSQFGLLTNLELTSVSDQVLSGTIPKEIGKLSSSLRALGLGRNQLEGSIPSDIGLLKEMTDFDGQSNGLTGALPSELGQLTKITNLQLESNRLSSFLPENLFQNMDQLAVLHLSNNALTGTVPTQLGTLPLESLFLDGNQLTGSLPSTLGLLNQTQWISLADNSLTGQIPEELRQLNAEQMKLLDLHNNDLSGTVPVEICSIPELILNCSGSLCGCHCPCITSTSPGIQLNDPIYP